MQSEVISNAKKRVISLLDEKSFVEFDELSSDSVIAGYGTIGFRPVWVFAEDSSVMSGAITKDGCAKICKVIDMATKTGVPLIGFFDSIGAKIAEGVKVFSGLQKVLAKMANASGVIPQIAVVSGNVTGIATFAVSFCDFVFMIEKTSKMFINSPQVLMSKEGIDVTADSIGSGNVHFEKTGSCQFLCKDEAECEKNIRKLIEFLPDNNLADTDILECDDLNRTSDMLLDENITALKVISEVVDYGSFFEVSSGFAKNIITGFARIGGKVVGVVANNLEYIEGKLNIVGIEKACKMVRFCDSFNIPIVTFIDNDGFYASVNEETNGAVRISSKLLFAYSDATVTKVNVIFGKAFGGASLMMGTSADITLAWENAKISVAAPVAAVNILYSEEIQNAESPVEFREKKLEEYLELEATPVNAAKDGFIDAVINPSETRQRIISALDMFSSKREVKSVRRHESVTF